MVVICDHTIFDHNGVSLEGVNTRRVRSIDKDTIGGICLNLAPFDLDRWGSQINTILEIGPNCVAVDYGADRSSGVEAG